MCLTREFKPGHTHTHTHAYLCPFYCPPLHVPLKCTIEKLFLFFLSAERCTVETEHILLFQSSHLSQTKPNKQTNRQTTKCWRCCFGYLFVHDICDCVLTVHAYYWPTSVVINKNVSFLPFLMHHPSLHLSCFLLPDRRKGKACCAPLFLKNSVVKDLWQLLSKQGN